MLISRFSGTHVLGLGLMGEYVGPTYDEVKRRPMFIVESLVGAERDADARGDDAAAVREPEFISGSDPQARRPV